MRARAEISKECQEWNPLDSRLRKIIKSSRFMFRVDFWTSLHLTGTDLLPELNQPAA